MAVTKEASRVVESFLHSQSDLQSAFSAERRTILRDMALTVVFFLDCPPGRDVLRGVLTQYLIKVSGFQSKF